MRVQPSALLAETARAWRRERRRARHRTDPDTVHRLRTASRRLQIAEEIASHWLGARAPGPWSEWGSAGRSLGRVRDLDVTIEILGAAADDAAPTARKELLAILRRIGRRWSRAAAGARAALAGGPARRLVRAEKAPREGAPPAGRILTAATGWWNRSKVDLRDDPAWRLDPTTASLRPTGRQAIHRLRVRSRELRYGLEWWGQLGVPVRPELTTFLREVQDTLGGLRDLRRASQEAAGRQLGPVRSRLSQRIDALRTGWPALARKRTLLTGRPFRFG